MRILLFWVNSVLKSQPSAFTHTQNAPVQTMRMISNEFCREEITTIIFSVIFENIASKLETMGPIFSSFNPFPSLPLVATDDRKQFRCCKIVFNNKARKALGIQPMPRHFLAF